MDKRYQDLAQHIESHSRRITRIETTMLDIHTSITAKLEELSKKLDVKSAEVTSAAQRRKSK